MPKLPFVSVPLPDELLYSYLLRLSIANGFDDIRDFIEHYVFSSDENKKRAHIKISYDVQDDLYRFAASVRKTDPNQTLSFYLKTSLFHGIAPLCSSYRSSCYVGSLSKYRNPSKLLSSSYAMISKLRFCHLCQKEDLNRHGDFYYHRAHQMPGVTVCHKHGCALHVYTLLSSFREDIVELQCKECGDCFLSTPNRILSGWGCPSCDGKMDDASLFQRLFHARAGNFELLSTFQSKGQPVRVRHLSCGKEFDTSVQRCLNHQLKCRCEYTLDETTVREKIKSLGNFELLEYKTSMQPIILQHKTCGSTFRVMYHTFIKDPRCSICQRLRNNRHFSNEEFVQKVFDLVGDEYTPEDPYESAKKRILIRHNRCNTLQVYSPEQFLHGRRCKRCNPKCSEKEFVWNVWYESSGEYTVVGLHSHHAKILNTITNEKITLKRQFALQELRRPTQSNYLPLEKRNSKPNNKPNENGQSA